METAAPWECCPAAEVRCFDSSQAPMKGRLKRFCRRAEQDKAVTATEKNERRREPCVVFLQGSQKKEEQKHKHSHLQLSFISTFRAASQDRCSHCIYIHEKTPSYIFLFFFSFFFLAYWDCLSVAVSNSALILRIKGLQKKKRSFEGVRGRRDKVGGFLGGSRQDEKKLGAHRNAKEVALSPFFSLPSESLRGRKFPAPPLH